MIEQLSMEAYEQLMRMAPIACVEVAIFNPSGEDILLAKRTNMPAQGEYYVPGGGIRKNETIRGAAIRQMQDELGVTLDISRLATPLVAEDLWGNSRFPGVVYHAIAIYFAYRLKDDEYANLAITLDGQHNEWAWFSRSDKSLHPFVKSRIAMITKHCAEGRVKSISQ
jgi:colanic acid biosynthesis protein WcaH